jgi:hypothetical protein
MPAKKTKLTDAERAKRIRAIAREIGTDNDPESLERRTFGLNRRDSGEAGFVIHFRKEVICDAESLFARST